MAYAVKIHRESEEVYLIEGATSEEEAIAAAKGGQVFPAEIETTKINSISSFQYTIAEVHQDENGEYEVDFDSEEEVSSFDIKASYSEETSEETSEEDEDEDEGPCYCSRCECHHEFDHSSLDGK